LGDSNKLVPSIVVGVMGSTGIYLIPLLLGAMVTDRGFTEQQAGLMASADLAGYAVTTFLTALLLNRFSWRRMAFLGIAVMLVANVATTFAHHAPTFAAVRFLSGLGAGVLAAIANVSLGQTGNPDRNYGLLFSASLLFGTAGLWGLPLLLDRFGLNAAYFFIAALAVLVLIAATSLPNSKATTAVASASGTGRRGWLPAGAVLLSVALFWMEQNAIYAYLERIGNASQLSAHFIGFCLGMANLSGFLGAALVAWLGTRFGRLGPLAVSMAMQLACLWALSGHVSSAAYLIALGCIALAWNVANPIQLGVLATVDKDGRALALAATVIGVGLAAGPALGAAVLTEGNYDAILWVAAGLAVISFVLVLPALLRRQ
jgi:predicted MFS family arabinose efflux permease